MKTYVPFTRFKLLPLATFPADPVLYILCKLEDHQIHVDFVIVVATVIAYIR